VISNKAAAHANSDGVLPPAQLEVLLRLVRKTRSATDRGKSFTRLRHERSHDLSAFTGSEGAAKPGVNKPLQPVFLAATCGVSEGCDPQRAGLYHLGCASQPGAFGLIQPDFRASDGGKFRFNSAVCVGSSAYYTAFLDHHNRVIDSIEVRYLTIVFAVEDHDVGLLACFERANL